MIKDAIKCLNRSLLVLNDIPDHIKTEKQKVISSLNNIFEDYHDQFEDKETLKKLTQLREDVMSEIDNFCNIISTELKEDIKVVEE